MKKPVILNVMTSGTMETLPLIPRYQLIFANAVGIIGLVILYFFSFSSFSKGNTLIGLSTLISGSAIFVVFVLTRFLKSYTFMRYFFAFTLLLLFLFLTYTGGTEGSGIFWALSYPIMSMFLLGAGIGTIVAFIFWGITALILLAPSLNLMGFSSTYAMRYLGAFITIWVFAFFYQRTMESIQKKLKKTTENLAREKQQTDSIMHNVEQGLFLLDENFCISQSYSASLRLLLMMEDPSGQKLSEILKPYLCSQDQQALVDYLEMYDRNDINPELLKEINPLQEIKLKDKILRFSFGKVPHETGKPVLLGFVADITEEYLLQQKLQEEEENYSRNMEHLFQIIHIEPVMMEDFLEQTGSDMNLINNLLKEDSPNKPILLEKVYQILHSMKGNALLLGLSSFGGKIHKIEERVHFAMDHNPEWEDFLDIILLLGNLKQDVGEILELIERIRSFTMTGTSVKEKKKGDKNPLITALENLIQSEAESKGKKAELSAVNFKLDEIPEVLHQTVKDISIQLIRNSLAHGIETPEVREKNKKSPHGTIEIRSEIKDKQLIIYYKDDGCGMDPEKIREKAMLKKIIPPKTLEKMKISELVGLIFHPGFSTSDETDMSSGRGIGMNVIKEKVNQQGGRLKLSSKTGQYSRFSFHFPL